MNKITLICMSSFLFLVGCAESPYKNSEVNLVEFQNQKKSIVVTRAEVFRDNLLFGKLKFNLLGSWIKTDEVIKDNTPTRYAFVKTGFLASGSKSMAAYMVDPGKYALESLRVFDGNYDTTLSFYNPKVRADYGYDSFAVQPGEVIYIGDISLVDRENNPHFKVTDDFESAKKYMTEKYPELAEILEKRLIQPLSRE